MRMNTKNLPKLSEITIASNYLAEGIRCCDNYYFDDVLYSPSFLSNTNPSYFTPAQVCEQVTNSFHGNHHCVLVFIDEKNDQEDEARDEEILEGLRVLQQYREKSEIYGLFLRPGTRLWKTCSEVNYFTAFSLKNDLQTTSNILEAVCFGTTQNLFERQEVKSKFRIKLPMCDREKAVFQILLKSERTRTLSLTFFENEMFHAFSVNYHVNAHENKCFELSMSLKKQWHSCEFLRYIIWDADTKVVMDEGQLRFMTCDMVSESVYNCLKENLLKIGILTGNDSEGLFVNRFYSLIDSITNEHLNKRNLLYRLSWNAFDSIQQFVSSCVKFIGYELGSDNDTEIGQVISMVDVIVFYPKVYRYQYFTKRILEAFQKQSKPCVIALPFGIKRDDREEEVVKREAIEIPSLMNDPMSTCTDFELDQVFLKVVEEVVKKVNRQQTLMKRMELMVCVIILSFAFLLQMNSKNW